MRVRAAPLKPVALFDGDCGFCARWANHWARKAGERITFMAFQDPQVGLLYPELDRAALTRAFHLVDSDGQVTFGAEAVFKVMALTGNRKWEAAYRKVPGFRWVSEGGYRCVAQNRSAFSFLTRWLLPK